MPDIRIYPTSALAAHAIAESMVDLAEKSIDTRGRFTLALSGGSTPRQLYKLLATPEYNDRIDWSKVHAFFADERCVPPDSDENNSHMARGTFLDHVDIPLSQIHRIHGEIEPEKAAADYEKELRDFFGRREAGSGARFDLVLLGVGEDGHTASLFPGTDALTEDQHWVLAVYAQHLQSWRVTLTPVALSSAQNIFFFVTGDSKANIMRRIHSPTKDDASVPAATIRPRSGSVRWYLDGAAARLLTSSPDWMPAKGMPSSQNGPGEESSPSE